MSGNQKNRGHHPMNAERKALRMDWEEYIVYALEIDRDDVNEDALAELAEGLE